MVEKIVQHKHCVECGKVVAPKKKTCSEKCESTLNERVKKRKLWLFVWLGAVAIFIAVMIVSMGGGF